MNNKNIMLLTDSYKATHWKQYPPKTSKIYSYLESRGGKFKEVVFFGLQYILKEYLSGQVITKEKIDEAETFWNLHFGSNHFNREGWEYILNTYNGHLPIKIQAVPEGTVVPVQNVLLTIENTDPKCFWLTNFLETLIMQIWYPITVATNSREIKKVIHSYLEKTGTPESIDFKLHDFGFRGVSSVETSAIGAASHLVNFLGTDTIPGILLTMNYYGSGMSGFSIPASEHSTITSWTSDKELEAYRNMLEKYPTGLVACVSDSYDIYNACKNLWGSELKDMILSRNGALVIRPDSGDPVEVISKCLDILGDHFGVTINEKGYKLLPPQIRVIQGDGINLEMVETILSVMESNKWSADNIAFGSGGALLQKFDRDTQKFAIKCSHAIIDGAHTDVQKTPVTDSGKRSKKGILKLISSGDSFETVNFNQDGKNEMVTVYNTGVMILDQTFDSVRNNARLKNK